tara:strand:- start:15836 stop:16999 length:1164 start_codon:yes stop_codon:yes gene_type:complete
MILKFLRWIIGWEAAVKNVETISERIKTKSFYSKAKKQLIVALCGQVTAIFIVLYELKSKIDSWFPISGFDENLVWNIGLFLTILPISCIGLYRLSLYFVLRVYDEANEHSLLHESLFTYPLILGYNILVYYVYMISMSHSININIEGIKLFIKLYQPLITVLGSIGVFMTFIALINRSELTSKQIVIANNQYKESQNQNTFTNYFKHLEEFEKYLGKQSSLFNYLGDIRELHGDLYGTFNDFHYEISTEFLLELQHRVDRVHTISTEISDSRPLISEDKMVELLLIVKWIEDTFSMNAVNDYDFKFSIRLDEEGVTELDLPVKYSDLANLIRNRVNVIDLICKFSNKNPLSDSFTSLCFMGVEHEDDDFFEYSKSTRSFEFKGISN